MRQWQRIFIFLCIFSSLSVSAQSSDCESWLASSNFGAIGRLGIKAAPEMGAVDEKLREAYKSFQISPHGAQSESYETLLKYLENLKVKISKQRESSSNSLNSESNEYERLHGGISRFFGLNGSRRFYRERVKPLRNEVSILSAALEVIEDLQASAAEAKISVSKDGALHQAKVIYGLFYEDLQSGSAVILAKTLMGQKENLEAKLERAGEIFAEFSEEHQEEIAAPLTAILVGRGKTSLEDIEHLKELFEEFYDSHDENIAAALAGIAFSHKTSAASVSQMNEIHEALYNSTDLDENEILPLVGYFASRTHVPTKAEVELIEDKRKKIYEHASVDSADSVLMLMILFLTRGENFPVADLNQMLKLYDQYSDRDLDTNAAAILAATSFLTGKLDDNSIGAIHAIWTEFYALDGIEQNQAAALTLQLVVTREGVRKDLDLNLLGGIAALDSSVGASGSSIFDISQGMITGDFINFDGNPFTPF